MKPDDDGRIPQKKKPAAWCEPALSTKCRRRIATFSWPVKCLRSFALLMSFSSLGVYTNPPGGKLHFRLKQHNKALADNWAGTGRIVTSLD
jgi:hypothetical protein